MQAVPSLRIDDNEEDKIDSLLIQDDEDNSINQDSGSSLSYFQEERKMFVNNCKPSGQVMALGVMHHKNKYVVKKGIQLYKRWNFKEGIEIIKSLHFEETCFQK